MEPLDSGDPLTPRDTVRFQEPFHGKILDVVRGRVIAIVVKLAVGAIPTADTQGFRALQGDVFEPAARTRLRGGVELTCIQQ